MITTAAVTVTLERIDGSTDTLEISEGVARFDFVRMAFTGGGIWSKDSKTFTPWHEIRRFTVSE